MADPAPNKPTVAPAGADTAPPEQMGRLAAGLAAKHGAGPGPKPVQPAAKPTPPNRGGGRRPIAEEAADYLRKNGLMAVPAQTAGGLNVPEGAAQYLCTPEFVKECSQTLLKGIEAWRVRQVYLRVITISRDKELSRQLAEQAGAPPGCIDVMSVSLAELSQKYAWLASWTPEALLIVAMGTWVAKEVTLTKKLNELEAQIVEARKKGQPTPEPPKPA